MARQNRGGRHGRRRQDKGRHRLPTITARACCLPHRHDLLTHHQGLFLNLARPGPWAFASPLCLPLLGNLDDIQPLHATRDGDRDADDGGIEDEDVADGGCVRLADPLEDGGGVGEGCDAEGAGADDGLRGERGGVLGE